MCLITVDTSYIDLEWQKCTPTLNENALNNYKVKKQNHENSCNKGYPKSKVSLFWVKNKSKRIISSVKWNRSFLFILCWKIIWVLNRVICECLYIAVDCICLTPFSIWINPTYQNSHPNKSRIKCRQSSGSQL